MLPVFGGASVAHLLLLLCMYYIGHFVFCCVLPFSMSSFLSRDDILLISGSLLDYPFSKFQMNLCKRFSVIVRKLGGQSDECKTICPLTFSCWKNKKYVVLLNQTSTYKILHIKS